MKFMRVKEVTAEAEPQFQCLVCGKIVKPTSRKETEKGIVYTLVCSKCGAKDTVTVRPEAAV